MMENKDVGRLKAPCLRCGKLTWAESGYCSSKTCQRIRKGEEEDISTPCSYCKQPTTSLSGVCSRKACKDARKRTPNQQWFIKNKARYLRTAVSKGIPFDITEADIPDNDHCAITGIKFDWDDSWWVHPSLDRIDCNKGYVPGNIQLVCWGINHIKGVFETLPQEHYEKMKAAIVDLNPIPKNNTP